VTEWVGGSNMAIFGVMYLCNAPYGLVKRRWGRLWLASL